MTRSVVRWLLVSAILCGIADPARAASYRTRNFLVTAKRPEIARQAAEFAEYYRRTKAIEWLGSEIPDWPNPCTVKVKVTPGEAGGATSFAFDGGRVVGQDMSVEGPLERILNSVLPHEVTHTIFAAKFGRPLPRWADEGGAVLSEDYQELARHDLLVRELINQDRMIPLRRLFLLTEYPDDVMALYAQGFSVSNFLVSLRGKSHFLDFVWDGQVGGWDRALAAYYGFASCDALENRWIQWLREGRGTGADRPLASANRSPAWDPQRIVRGQMADDTLANRYAPHAQAPAHAAPPAPPSPFDPSIQVAATGVESAVELTPREAIATTRPPSQGHAWLPWPAGSQASTSAMTPPDGVTKPSNSASAEDEFRRRLIPIAVGRTRRSHDS